MKESLALRLVLFAIVDRLISTVRTELVDELNTERKLKMAVKAVKKSVKKKHERVLRGMVN